MLRCQQCLLLLAMFLLRVLSITEPKRSFVMPESYAASITAPREGRLATMACAIILSLAAVLVLRPPAAAEETDTAQAISTLRALSHGFTAVAEDASPAVVFIKAERRVQAPMRRRGMQPPMDPHSPFNDEFFRRFFGDRFRGPEQPEGSEPAPRYRTGQGSGFIVAANGDILTNHHVVAGADRLTVTLHDGREFPATLVGSDEKSDLAVLRIEGENLPTLPLGSSAGLRVGEWVIAIGNPFGLSHTVTAGIVSAKGRSRVGIADYEDFIQTDAAINPGNSGGPLLNLDGEVVGINTAIFSRSGGYMGIGFAIPIDMASAIYLQLRDNGLVVRGYLGVRIQDLNTELAESFGLARTDGVVITEVEAGSAAEQGGLRSQDVVIGLDAQPVLDVARFRNAIAMIAPGTEISLEVWRDGERKKLTITMGSMADAQVAQAAVSDQLEAWGITVSVLDDEQRQAFNLREREGVVVTAVADGSRAAASGIRPGQLIVGVNHQEVNSLESLASALEQAKQTQRPIRLVLRQGTWTVLAVLPQQP
ncbi:MAG: DegQ family serine endoprotease [Planctomycetota bacterium]|nr:MAG: DegQ family serine endoprotease [Planctomycetota bacterium]